MSCLLPPACSFCKLYLGDDETQERDCVAFREIPEDIIMGRHDHKTPYPGDHNYRFQLNEELKEDFEEIKRMRGELKIHLK